MANELGSKTIILYGESGLGKSLNATFFAKFMYQRYGRPVCLVSAESSSRTIFDGLIRAGIVIPVWLKVNNALSTMRKLVKGQWPHSSPQGYEWKAIDWAGAQAPCGYVWEGLTSIAEVCQESSRREARLQREQKGDAFDEEGEHFVPASKSLYGLTQDEVLFFLRDSDGLPVHRNLWTAHEYKGQEQDGDSILGPGLVGRAKTPHIQKYCAMMLHIDGYPVRMEQSVGTESLPVQIIKRRIWYQKHPDPRTNILYPAKVTLPGAKIKDLWAEYPGGYFEPTLEWGLDKFLEVEAALIESTASAETQWKAEVDAAHKKQSSK